MKIIKSQKTIEGAGVVLERVFGDPKKYDPFLLLDDMSSNNSKDFEKGFPFHPHRGIETVTYIIKGKIEHQDHLGNKGTIKDGEVQWMTAGSGIIHQEMPGKVNELIGFQLWINLPQKNKMMNPRYQEIIEIPEIKNKDHTVKIIAGKYDQVQGPVKDIMIDPEYLDIQVHNKFEKKINKTHTNLVYFFQGQAKINGERIKKGELTVIQDDFIVESENARFLFISGKPLNQPIVWYGPIAMNTKEEIRTAFRELEEGTFIKIKGKK